ITRAVARIKHGLQDQVLVGNLHAQRDWGYAPEYVEGMWRMLQRDRADDYVLATGVSHTVKEFADLAFAEAGMHLEWVGEGEKEQGVEKQSGKVRMAVDPRYYRPTEVDLLVGDATKAKQTLGWQAKTELEELVRIMVRADLEKVRKRGF
ncbi:MAG TPA: GDP-mannose 4,6-dehydratase, partial [bacterium]|nr:GDP-mannose 4,6-dehydratase [bacterium]